MIIKPQKITRKINRLFFAKVHPLDLRWHILDAAINTDAGGVVKVMTLHGEYILPKTPMDNVNFLALNKGQMCERCLDEFINAAEHLQQFGFFKFEDGKIVMKNPKEDIFKV